MPHDGPTLMCPLSYEATQRATNAVLQKLVVAIEKEDWGLVKSATWKLTRWRASISECKDSCPNCHRIRNETTPCEKIPD